MKSWESNAEMPEMDGKQYHIDCRAGDIAPYVILPGDPSRSDEIAAQWTEKHFVAHNREHRTFTGVTGGVPVSVTSSGMGAPAAAIAIEELLRVGAKTIIRLGTCGSLQPNIKCGDLIINTASVRHDGASDTYVEKAYPACANHEVVEALIKACKMHEVNFHVGIGCSTASFHCGQGRPGYNNYSQSFFSNIVDDMRKANVLNFEMETAILFTLGGLYGFRSGSICTVVANRITNEMKSTSLLPSIEVVNSAIEILASDSKSD